MESSRAFLDKTTQADLATLQGLGMTVIADPDRASFQAAAIAAETVACAAFGAGRIARLRGAA